MSAAPVGLPLRRVTTADRTLDEPPRTSKARSRAAQVECRRRARIGRPLSRPWRMFTESLSLSSGSALRMLRASRKISTQDNSST